MELLSINSDPIQAGLLFSSLSCDRGRPLELMEDGYYNAMVLLSLLPIINYTSTPWSSLPYTEKHYHPTPHPPTFIVRCHYSYYL